MWDGREDSRKVLAAWTRKMREEIDKKPAVSDYEISRQLHERYERDERKRRSRETLENMTKPINDD